MVRHSKKVSGKQLHFLFQLGIKGLDFCFRFLLQIYRMRSPQLPVGLGARALGSRAASPPGFGAFALLDDPGLTQFRGLGFKGLRV